MLYWITADFWEGALGFKGSRRLHFLGICSGGRDAGALHLPKLSEFGSSPPALLVFGPRGVTGLFWVQVVPTVGPQGHSQVGAGVGDHQPGDRRDTAPPCVARGKIDPGLS